MTAPQLLARRAEVTELALSRTVFRPVDVIINALSTALYELDQTGNVQWETLRITGHHTSIDGNAPAIAFHVTALADQ